MSTTTDQQMVTPDPHMILQVPSRIAVRDVHYSHGSEREITDSTATTIASWWQSSGPVGRTLATLASGYPVSLDDLLDDIAASRRYAGSSFDSLSLDMLATWAIRKVNGPLCGECHRRTGEPNRDHRTGSLHVLCEECHQ